MMVRKVGALVGDSQSILSNRITGVHSRRRRLSPFMEWWHEWPSDFRVSLKKVHRIYPGQIELRGRKFDKRKIKKWMKLHKSDLHCRICGVSQSEKVLDFHHIYPAEKQYWIRDMMTGFFSPKEILRELEKCEPLCRQCHMTRHGHLNK